LENIGIEINGD